MCSRRRERNGRQRLRAELLGSRGIDIFRIVQGLDQQPRRDALEFAQLRRLADAGHGLAALLIGDVADRGQQGFRVFQYDRVRIFLIAHPGGAGASVREIPGHRKRRIPHEAGFAVGSEGLPRLPELGIAFDGEAFHAAQRIGAAFRGDGLFHEISPLP